jgi:hypothetical protein
MATLTISTNGEARGKPCHDVTDISHTRVFAPDVNEAVVTLDTDQALAIAYDLLYQAVDAGVLTGWNVQFPERA